MGRKKLPAVVEGLRPGVAGVAADADTLCLPCARKAYGKDKIAIVVSGDLHELDDGYPEDSECNPIHPVLTTEEFEGGAYCGNCFRPLDVVAI